MVTKTKKDFPKSTNSQTNYITENPPTEELSKLFFWENALSERELERDEQDTVKSLIAEMRYS